MSANNALNDPRVGWIRQRVVISLGITPESFDAYFTDSLERARSASIAREEIITFLSDKYSSGSTLFFSAIKQEVDKEIEEEIEVEEEVTSAASEEKKTDTEGEVTPEGAVEEGKTEGADTAGGVEEGKTEASTPEAAAPEGGDAAVPAPEGETAAAPEGEVKEGEEAAPAAPVPAPVAKKVTKMVKVKKMVKSYECTLLMSIDTVSEQMSDLAMASFMRSQDGVIPSVGGGAESLNEHLEFNYFTGDLLYNISNLVKHVYIPGVASANVDGLPTPPVPVSTNESSIDGGDVIKGVDSTLRSELGLSMNKFHRQLNTVVMQSRGDVNLTIPNVTITDIIVAASDLNIVNSIESAVEDWTVVMSNAVDYEHRIDSSSKRTPLGEIDFWRARSASLSPLYDQIQLPKVQQMLEVVSGSDNPQLSSFHYHYSELTKLFLEAKDNVKFLTTLERHFRHITDGLFHTIIDSMQGMVNGLRQVWVISRHFNTDDKMAPLMEAIAETLGKRVREEVKLSEILIMDHKDAKKILVESKDVLSLWGENYFRMRKRIEDSGSDHRWEFDRKALFGKTDYMIGVCNDIVEVIDAIEYFRIFLGPELKQVTGDSAEIEDILKRVSLLSAPFQVPFEEKIFEKGYEKPWENIMKTFRSAVVDVEAMTETFIENSFRQLRSAELAFELVQNFQRIGDDNLGTGSSNAGNATATSTTTAGDRHGDNKGKEGGGRSIKDQITARYDDILKQYLNELGAVKELFEIYKEKPPIAKNFPPVAGAIAWARDLYHRAKRPILRFKNFGSGLLEDELGEQVKTQYLDFARSIDDFITELFNEWESGVSVVVADKLRQSVLRSISKYTVPTVQTDSKGKKRK
jgi:dynein heavy chain